MTVALLNYQDCSTYSTSNPSLNLGTSVNCSSGRMILYAAQFDGHMLLVNPDYTSVYVDDFYGNGSMPQVVPMGGSGSTDYVAMVRDSSSGTSGIEVDLWSIDSSNTFALLDTLVVATDDPVMYNAWAQPSTDTKFLIPYEWYDTPSDTWLQNLTTITRTGTSLSMITPIPTGDAYFGNFDSTIKTGINAAWFINYNTNTLDLIDDSTLSVVASVADPDSVVLYSNDEITGNGILVYSVYTTFLQHVVADFSTSGIVDVRTFYGERVADAVYDVNGNQYVLTVYSSGFTNRYTVYVRQPGDPDYTFLDSLTSRNYGQVALCRFKDGVAVVDAGEYNFGFPSPPDGAFVRYYGVPVPGNEPPTNDNVQDAKGLYFPYGSVTTETGSLQYANGSDATGTLQFDYSNVWYSMVIPEGQRGIIEFQIDHRSTVGTNSFEIKIWNNAQFPLAGYGTDDSSGVSATSYQSPQLSPSTFFTALGARISVNAGDVVTIEVSRDVAMDVGADSDFTLRAAFHSYATPPYDADRIPLPDGTVSNDTYYLGIEEWIDNYWFFENRGGIAALSSSGNVTLTETIDPRFQDSFSLSLNGLSEGYGNLYTQWGYARQEPGGTPVPGGLVAPTPIGGGQWLAQDMFVSGIQFNIYNSNFEVQTSYEVGASNGVYGMQSGGYYSDGYIFFIGVSAASHQLLVRVSLTNGAVRTADLGTTTSSNPEAAFLFVRGDGKIIVVMKGFSFSLNYFDYSAASKIWDPVTMTQVGTISWSNAPFHGYMTMASGYTAQEDNALHTWGFSAVSYFGRQIYQPTADGRYAVSSTWYPSGDVVYVSGSSWGYDYRSSVFKTDLYTGVTSLWAHIEHPWPDIHGPDPLDVPAYDRRSFSVRAGCPTAYPDTLTRGSGSTGSNRVVFDI